MNTILAKMNIQEEKELRKSASKESEKFLKADALLCDIQQLIEKKVFYEKRTLELIVMMIKDYKKS